MCTGLFRFSKMDLSRQKTADRANFRNIIVLSTGFMLLMAAWLTTAGIEQTILQSVKADNPDFTGNGYLSQAIISGVFAITNFIAPMVVSLLGVRTSMVFGTCLYSVFIANFLYPQAWLLYFSSAIIGFGTGIVWVSNGIYVTQCSRKETIGKHMGIHWGIMASGQLLGNVFVFWRFQGMNHIDSNTRFVVISGLTAVCIMASITLVFLGAPAKYEEITTEDTKESDKLSRSCFSIFKSILEPFRLLKNKHMLLLIPSSLYNGLELAIFASIYPTSVGFTEAFGGDTRKLVGLAGILNGFGAVVGGLVFGYLIEKISLLKSRRTFIVTFCCSVHCVSVALVYLNLPDAAPLYPSLNTSWINPPSVYVAMLCAFLFGIGDTCISTQMTAAIGVIWKEDPSSALALYLFFKGGTCAAGYFIGTLTGLYNQLLIFLTLVILGTVTFTVNEKLILKKEVGFDKLSSCSKAADPVSFIILRKSSAILVTAEKRI